LRVIKKKKKNPNEAEMGSGVLNSSRLQLCLTLLLLDYYHA